MWKPIKTLGKFNLLMFKKKKKQIYLAIILPFKYFKVINLIQVDIIEMLYLYLYLFFICWRYLFRNIILMLLG